MRPGRHRGGSRVGAELVVNRDEQPSFAGAVVVRCRAPADGDALDLELANRLNGLLNETAHRADYTQSLRPVFKELLAWALATACLTAAAAFWLV